MSKIERVYLRGDFGLTGLYCKAHDVDQLEAINAELLEALKYAPVPSKYHGIRGFETNRFLSDYEAWMKNRRAAIAKAEGGRHEL